MSDSRFNSPGFHGEGEQQQAVFSTVRQNCSGPDTNRGGPAHDCADKDRDESFPRQERYRPGQHGHGRYSDDRWIYLRAYGEKKEAQ